MADQKYCPHCGKANLPEAEYCGYCGGSFKPRPVPPPPDPGRNWTKTVVPTAIAGLLLAILAGYLLLDWPGRKGSTSEQAPTDLAIVTDLTNTQTATTALTLTQLSEHSPVFETTAPQDTIVPANTLQPAVTPVPSKPAISASNIPQPSYTPLPTYTPRPTHTVIPSPTLIAVHFTLPTERNWQDLESIWEKKEIDFEDMQSPGTKLYSIAVDPGDVLRWSFRWCATDDAYLREILVPLTIEMLVNGSPLTSSQFLQHNVTATDEWKCRYWTTILDDWQSGTVVELEVDYTLATSIFDGTVEYSPGSYHQIIQVAVR